MHTADDTPKANLPTLASLRRIRLRPEDLDRPADRQNDAPPSRTVGDESHPAGVTDPHAAREPTAPEVG